MPGAWSSRVVDRKSNDTCVIREGKYELRYSRGLRKTTDHITS